MNAGARRLPILPDGYESRPNIPPCCACGAPGGFALDAPPPNLGKSVCRRCAQRHPASVARAIKHRQASLPAECELSVRLRTSFNMVTLEGFECPVYLDITESEMSHPAVRVAHELLVACEPFPEKLDAFAGVTDAPGTPWTKEPA